MKIELINGQRIMNSKKKNFGRKNFKQGII